MNRTDVYHHSAKEMAVWTAEPSTTSSKLGASPAMTKLSSSGRTQRLQGSSFSCGFCSSAAYSAALSLEERTYSMMLLVKSAMPKRRARNTLSLAAFWETCFGRGSMSPISAAFQTCLHYHHQLVYPLLSFQRS
jgi:hypothetical protein